MIEFFQKLKDLELKASISYLTIDEGEETELPEGWVIWVEDHRWLNLKNPILICGITDLDESFKKALQELESVVI